MRTVDSSQKVGRDGSVTSTLTRTTCTIDVGSRLKLTDPLRFVPVISLTGKLSVLILAIIFQLYKIRWSTTFSNNVSLCINFIREEDVVILKVLWSSPYRMKGLYKNLEKGRRRRLDEIPYTSVLGGICYTYMIGSLSTHWSNFLGPRDDTVRVW